MLKLRELDVKLLLPQTIMRTVVSSPDTSRRLSVDAASAVDVTPFSLISPTSWLTQRESTWRDHKEISIGLFFVVVFCVFLLFFFGERILVSLMVKQIRPLEIQQRATY